MTTAAERWFDFAVVTASFVVNTATESTLRPLAPAPFAAALHMMPSTYSTAHPTPTIPSSRGTYGLTL